MKQQKGGLVMLEKIIEELANHLEETLERKANELGIAEEELVLMIANGEIEMPE